MQVFLFCCVAAWVFWMLGGRAMYIRFRYREEVGIPLPSDMERDSLMKALQENLHYPDLKEIYYDEHGQIVIKCKYGIHTLRKTDTELFVGKGEVKYSSQKEAQYIEEAECLSAYIQKIFSPDAPVNPQEMHQRLKNARRNNILTTLFLVGGLVIAFLASLEDSGVTDSIASKNISDSYLSQYSQSVTIGEAFNEFFTDPQWVAYKDGAHQRVDFRGGCIYDDSPATMVITFIVNDNTFVVDGITIDGVEVSWLQIDGILNTIFSDY